MTEREVMEVRVDRVHVSKFNPRRIDKDDPATVELAKSMEGAAGLIQPITVRPHPDRPGQWELLSGSRRLHAAGLLGWEFITAEVRQVDDATAITIVVVENLQRQNLTAMEEAQGLAVLLGSGKDRAAIAAATGWPLSRVARRAQLLKLTSEWFQLTSTTFPDWTPGHLELIARLPEEAQNRLSRKLKRYHSGLHLSIADLQAEIDDVMKVLSKAPFSLADCELDPDAGACTACPNRSSVQPELWFDDDDLPGDLKGHDRCLNLACFNRKLKAFRDDAIRKAREKNAAVVLLSSVYYAGCDDGPKPPKGTIFSRAWKKAKKSAAKSLQGIIVHGAGIGRVLWVTVEKEALEVASGGGAKKSRRTEPTLKEKREKLEEERTYWMAGRLEDEIRKLEAGAVLRIDEGPINVEMMLRRALEAGLLFGIDVNARVEKTAAELKLLGEADVATLVWVWIVDGGWAIEGGTMEIAAICEWLGPEVIRFEDLEAAAIEEHPEPAEWTAKKKSKKVKK